MSKETDYRKAMKFETPEFIPVGAWILPAAFIAHGEELKKIVLKYPVAFPAYQEDKRYDVAAGSYLEGSHTDAWGCVWENVHTGREAIVRQHPVKTREAVLSLKLPIRDDGFPHGFMYLRLLDLRGFEEVMIDFAEEPPELKVLIDKVLKHNLRQAEIRLKQLEGKKGEIVYFGDDLGMQTGLAIGAEKWRKYLKPCFKQIYGKFKDAGL